MGRHTLLTPELLKNICDKVKGGMYPLQAALACGVGEATHYEWLQRATGDVKGREGSELYAEYADALKRSDAELEDKVVVMAVKKIDKSRSPIAPVLFLARRFRDRWGESVQVSATREAVAVMERLKAAWDADAVVDGQFRELPQGGQLPGELPPKPDGSQIYTCANQSEASGGPTGWPTPPPVDMDTLPSHATVPLDVDQPATAEATATAEPSLESGVSRQTNLPPTNLSTPDVSESTPSENSESKSSGHDEGSNPVNPLVGEENSPKSRLELLREAAEARKAVRNGGEITKKVAGEEPGT